VYPKHATGRCLLHRRDDDRASYSPTATGVRRRRGSNRRQSHDGSCSGSIRRGDSRVDGRRRRRQLDGLLAVSKLSERDALREAGQG